PAKYSSLEALGICTLNAGSDSKIAGVAKLFRELGKRTFALCDQQEAADQALIEAEVEIMLMHDNKGFETLVMEGTTDAALERFANDLKWPPHLVAKYPAPSAQVRNALADYFAWAKGSWG